MSRIELAKQESLDVLATEVAGKADQGHKHDWADILNPPSIPDISHLATKSELNSKANQTDVNNLSDTVDGLINLIADLQDEIDILKSIVNGDNPPDEPE